MSEQWLNVGVGLGNGRMNRRTLIKGVLISGGAAVLGSNLVGCAPGETPLGNATGKPTAGGKITVGVVSTIADFDPYNHLSVNFPMMATMYSYLITYDDQYKPYPDLAEKWTIAEDHLSATITLRKASFHDGTALTADDVVAGVERALDPKVALSQIAAASIIKSATAVDPQTVRLDFKIPTGEARILDFMYWFPVVEKSKNTPEQLKQEGAGSGPFTLDSYSPGNSLVLKKNPDYYDTELPYLDEIEFRFFDSQNSLVSALKGGSVGGALALPGRYNAQVKDKYEVTLGAPGALINLFRMNPLLPPFDNKKVRQAVARAIDRDRMIKEVQGGVGQAVYTGIAPNASTFEPELLKKYSFDLGAAEALLKDSGGGTSVNVGVDSSDEAGTSALLIMQEDLKKIGFTLTLDVMDTATLNAHYLAGELACVVRASSNAFSSLISIIGDSAYRLKNNVLWKDQLPKDYTDAVAALDVAATDEDVKAASHQLNLVITDEAWTIGMYTLENVIAFDKNIVGFDRTPADHPVFTRGYLG